MFNVVMDAILIVGVLCSTQATRLILTKSNQIATKSNIFLTMYTFCEREKLVILAEKAIENSTVWVYEDAYGVLNNHCLWVSCCCTCRDPVHLIHISTFVCTVLFVCVFLFICWKCKLVFPLRETSNMSSNYARKMALLKARIFGKLTRPVTEQ